ncbi:MAG: metalloregulator ArsR/SmtB family transcription factor [Anaerolineales bacterium]|nr:metalloregulator ArsR/SmtB family transcription factor [Anaerolineales bacterium]
MKKQSISQISEQIASLLAAIAAPQRIAILLAIGTGEACVCHLEAKLGYRQAYISQHLMALRQAGLLDSRRDGQYIFYHLTKPEVILLIQQAAKIGGVNLPIIEVVSPEKQCGCPNCSPEIIESLAASKGVQV